MEEVTNQPADQTVTIEIPADAVNVTVSQPIANGGTVNPVVEQPIQTDQPVVNPQETIQPQPTPEVQPLSTETKENVDNSIVADPPKHKGGPHCTFCPKHEELMNKIQLYVEFCKGNVDGSIHIPYMEELVDYDYMDMALDTLEGWQNNTHEMPQDENHVPAYHEELARTIKKLFNRQKLFLLKRTLSVNGQVAGAIFQLKANHGMIETEKKLLANDGDKEFKISIVEEDREKYKE